MKEEATSFLFDVSGAISIEFPWFFAWLVGIKNFEFRDQIPNTHIIERLISLYPETKKYMHLYDTLCNQMQSKFCAVWPWGENVQKRKDSKGNIRNAFDISTARAKLIDPPIPTMKTTKDGKRWSRQGQTAERLYESTGLGGFMLKSKWENDKYVLVSLTGKSRKRMLEDMSNVSTKKRKKKK